MTVQDKRPILALEIDVEEVFFHCAKAFLRSDAWNPESWDPTAVPSVATGDLPRHAVAPTIIRTFERGICAPND